MKLVGLQQLLVLAALTVQTSHCRRLILDLIDKLRSSQTKSISPSWEGIRRFDLIGTGKLPLQRHKLDTEFSGELLESKLGETDERFPPESYNRRVYTEGEEGRVVPGQFSRNRASPGYRDYNQDPETKIRNNYDRFGFTWAQEGGGRRRQRRSASPYSRIKIKIPNPFYFSNPGRRRVRIKKIISAPARSHNTERSGPVGFWDSQNFERNFFDLSLHEQTDGVLQHLDLLEPGLGGGEPQSLGSDDDYDYQDLSQLYTEEERELLGSGNFDIESGGTFYDEDDGGYSDSRYFPVGQYSRNNVDNFRDFADIKRERLFRQRRKYRY